MRMPVTIAETMPWYKVNRATIRNLAGSIERWCRHGLAAT